MLRMITYRVNFINPSKQITNAVAHDILSEKLYSVLAKELFQTLLWTLHDLFGLTLLNAKVRLMSHLKKKI